MRVQLIPKDLPKTAQARRRLVAASCALLGAGAARGQQTTMAPPDSGLLEEWSVDSALAYYHEDGRIQAIEPVGYSRMGRRSISMSPLTPSLVPAPMAP